MSDPKPLSKEDRIFFESPYVEIIYRKHIDVLLSAEAYWREAVKTLKPREWGCDGGELCHFCGSLDIGGPLQPSQHKPDCAWVKAQE